MYVSVLYGFRCYNNERPKGQKHIYILDGTTVENKGKTIN